MTTFPNVVTIHTILSEDKSAVVYFDYKEFNTDVWQKFLNVVFYDRYSKEREDRKKYRLWDKKSTGLAQLECPYQIFFTQPVYPGD